MIHAFVCPLRFPAWLLAAALLLSACSQVSAENYDKLATGMTPEEVHEILGSPDTVDAGTLGNFEVRTEIWKARKLHIELTFLNGKLMRKSIGEPGSGAASAES